MRLRRTEKEALAWQIIEMTLGYLLLHGRRAELGRGKQLVLRGSKGSLTFVYANPGNCLASSVEPFSLDIWDAGCGRVFSASWEPFALATFRYGGWMNELVSSSYVESSRRCGSAFVDLFAAETVEP